MVQVAIFLYAMLAGVVLTSLQRNRKLARANPEMLTMVGWGLFSLSSTLAALMTGLAVALALGLALPGLDLAAL